MIYRFLRSVYRLLWQVTNYQSMLDRNDSNCLSVSLFLILRPHRSMGIDPHQFSLVARLIDVIQVGKKVCRKLLLLPRAFRQLGCDVIKSTLSIGRG